MNYLIVALLTISLINLNLQAQDYKSVKIGDQIWMTENLNIDIPGSWCYENNSEYTPKYGRLYTYEAALKACPKGWHLPQNEEWNILINKLGGEDIAGRELKSDGSSNFNATLGGSRVPMGSYGLMGTYGCYWTSSKFDPNHAWYLYITDKNDYVISTYFTTTYGFSVRCLKN